MSKPQSDKEIREVQYREILRRSVYSYVKDVNNMMYNAILHKGLPKEQPLTGGTMLRLPDGSEFKIMLIVERLK